MDLKNATLIADDSTIGMTSGAKIGSSRLSFTPSGNYVNLVIIPHQKSVQHPKIGATSVDVWNYKDSILQSTQLLTGVSLFSPEPQISAVASVTGNKIIYIAREDEELAALHSKKGTLQL